MGRYVEPVSPGRHFEQKAVFPTADHGILGDGVRPDGRPFLAAAWFAVGANRRAHPARSLPAEACLLRINAARCCRPESLLKMGVSAAHVVEIGVCLGGAGQQRGDQAAPEFDGVAPSCQGEGISRIEFEAAMRRPGVRADRT